MLSKKTDSIDWVYQLYQIGRAIREYTSQEVQLMLLRHIVHGFDAERGSLALMDSDKETLTLSTGIDLPDNVIGSKISIGEGIIGWVAKHKKPLILNGDLSQDERFSNLKKRDTARREISAMCWPLITDHNVIGVFNISRSLTSIHFTEQDIKAGTLMTDLIVLVLDNILLHKKNEQHTKELQEVVIKLSEAQDQLLQSEKMASIGQLAAGVAHEINNPVGYVSSNISTLNQYIIDLIQIITMYEECEKKIDDEKARYEIQKLKDQIDLPFIKEDVESLIKESKEGVSRVKQIVQDLKDFSHVDQGQWQRENIINGINSSLNIAQNEIKYRAKVVKEFDPIPDIECIPSQINQVLLNMFVNAAQSIKDMGIITIKTGLKNKNTIFIEVKDTGVGIDPDHLTRVFEPFFTTKPIGKGTGLGLSLSYGIIKKHSGEISVTSTRNIGTCFRIELPVDQPNKKSN